MTTEEIVEGAKATFLKLHAGNLWLEDNCQRYYAVDREALYRAVLELHPFLFTADDFEEGGSGVLLLEQGKAFYDDWRRNRANCIQLKGLMEAALDGKGEGVLTVR